LSKAKLSGARLEGCTLTLEQLEELSSRSNDSEFERITLKDCFIEGTRGHAVWQYSKVNGNKFEGDLILRFIRLHEDSRELGRETFDWLQGDIVLDFNT
jgi:hypothetical protein